MLHLAPLAPRWTTPPIFMILVSSQHHACADVSCDVPTRSLLTERKIIKNGGWILVEMVINNDRQDISPAYMVLLVSMPRDSIIVVGGQFRCIQHPFAFLLLVTHSNQVLYCIVCRRECYQALSLILG